MTLRATPRPVLAAAALLCAMFAGGAVRRVQDTCGPFTDVSALFCPYVLEAYYTGITAGTSPTTFSPDVPITRAQSAVFTTKALNQALARGSRRAALGQWWLVTPPFNVGLGTTPLGPGLNLLQSDGQDIWVAGSTAGTVYRVRGSDGRLLESWTGATGAYGVLVALGRVFVTGQGKTSALYMIDPSQPAGDVATVATDIGQGPQGIAFDGANIWVAGTGSVAIITPSAAPPWPVQKVTTGFTSPTGMVFDGSNIWVTDRGSNNLFKLDANGSIIQTVAVGAGPRFPVFDGANIWVPNHDDATVTVVQANSGTVLKTTDPIVPSNPMTAAFDGQRILVTSDNGFPDNVGIWDAASLTFLGVREPGAFVASHGACSDGINFWIAVDGVSAGGSLLRF